MRKKIISKLLILGIIVGIAIIAYPTIAELYNSSVNSRLIDSYYETSTTTQEMIDEAFEKAVAYNESLKESEFSLINGDVESEVYFEALDILDGMIGIITIDSIDLRLPIYHGTSESVMQSGVGHLEGSSLPTGNESEHTLLTSHRGVLNAKLFDDLDKVELGDIIELEILNQTFTYEVTDIFVVLPDEVEYLEVVEGEELLTLITCTPYGINTHRLLVQATRIELEDEDIIDTEDTLDKEVNDAQEVEKNTLETVLIVIVGIIMTSLIATLIAILISRRNKKVLK